MWTSQPWRAVLGDWDWPSHEGLCHRQLWRKHRACCGAAKPASSNQKEVVLLVSEEQERKISASLSKSSTFLPSQMWLELTACSLFPRVIKATLPFPNDSVNLFANFMLLQDGSKTFCWTLESHSLYKWNHLPIDSLQVQVWPFQYEEFKKKFVENEYFENMHRSKNEWVF